MKDFDLTVIYNINQSQVAEIYNSKNKSFHANHNGDTYLMYNYIFNATRNATYKAARKYEALDMGDNRTAMEQEIRETVVKTLADEKLDGTITVTQVLIRSIIPADSVVLSANELVKAKNEYKTEEVKGTIKDLFYSIKSDKKIGALKAKRNGRYNLETQYLVTWGWFEDFILNSFFRVTGKADGNDKKLIFQEFRSVTDTFKELDEVKDEAAKKLIERSSAEEVGKVLKRCFKK